MANNEFLYTKRAEWGKDPKSGVVLRQTTPGNIIPKSKSDFPDDGLIRFVISTETPDRMGDIVREDGWEFDNFFKGGPGPVLFAHDGGRPPVGVSPSIERVKGLGVVGAVDFSAAAEISDFARTIKQMVEAGILKSTSVGFDPVEWKILEGHEDEFWPPFEFIKQELLEFSIVPIPANPDAVIIGRDAGIDMAPLDEWARETLDKVNSEDPIAVVPKRKLEAVVRALGYGRGMKFYDLSADEIRHKIKRKGFEEMPEETEIDTPQEVVPEGTIETKQEDEFLTAIKNSGISPEELLKAVTAMRSEGEDEDEETELADFDEDWLREVITSAASDLNKSLDGVLAEFTEQTGVVFTR
jgi:hypothetical protein